MMYSIGHLRDDVVLLVLWHHNADVCHHGDRWTRWRVSLLNRQSNLTLERKREVCGSVCVCVYHFFIFHYNIWID